jgi:hypothetical protein
MRKRGNRIFQRRRDVSAHWHAIGKLSPLPASGARKVSIAYHLAAKLLHEGKGHNDQMHQLAYALNMATALAELGIGAEYQADIHSAQRALMICHAHSHELGRWIIHNDEYKVICDALLVHDKQLDIATQAEVKAADEAIIRCTRAGDVIVVERAAAGT